MFQLCFSNLAPELVIRIFGLFSSRKPGWNFSYEPKGEIRPAVRGPAPVSDPGRAATEPGQPGSREEALNPLSPNINIQILQTDLHTFPLRISWENLITDQGIFSLVIIC